MKTSTFLPLSAFTGRTKTHFLKAELGEVVLWSLGAGSSPQRVCPAANNCVLLFLVFCECFVSFTLGISLNCWGFSGVKLMSKAEYGHFLRGQNMLGNGLLKLCFKWRIHIYLQKTGARQWNILWSSNFPALNTVLNLCCCFLKDSHLDINHSIEEI